MKLVNQLLLATVLMLLCCAGVMGFGFTSGGSGGKRYDLSSITGKGAYAAGTTYVKNDLVTYDDASYVSVQNANTGHTPDNTGTWWILFPQGPQGTTGASGANGATWYSGFDTPAGAGITGADGDFFFDTSSVAKIYKKTSGTWSQVNAIRGPAGANGSNGSNGTNGEDGDDGADGADGAGITAGTDGTFGLGMQCNSAAFTGYSSTGMYVFCNSSGQMAYRINGGAETVVGSGGGTWGSITGTLSDQEDLQDALGAITAGGINITTAVPSTSGSANLNDSTHVLSIASTTGVTTFTGSFTAWDTTPAAFSFTDITDATLSTEYTSAAVQITGINYPAAVTTSGGTAAICTGTDIGTCGAFSSSPGNISVNQYARARVTSSSSNSTAVTAPVTIGGVSDTYSVTTVAASGPAAYDNFTGTDGTALSSHTSDSGHTWAASGSSTLAINTNHVYSSNNANIGFYASSVTPASANYSVSMVMTGTATGNTIIGPAGRISGTTGYWVRYGDTGAYTLYATTTSIGTYSSAFPSGTKVTLDMSGSTIRVLIDDVERISVTDTAFTAAGNPGIGSYYSSAVTTVYADTWEMNQ